MALLPYALTWTGLCSGLPMRLRQPLIYRRVRRLSTGPLFRSTCRTAPGRLLGDRTRPAKGAALAGTAEEGIEQALADRPDAAATCWATAAALFGLQLTGYIDWPWWWITAPLWAPLAVT